MVLEKGEPVSPQSKLKLPTKIKIGQRTIQVHIRTSEDDGMMTDNYGYTIRDTGNVYIRHSTIPSVMRSTLLHELLHSILSIYEPRAGQPKRLEDFEEWVVSILEEPFITMLRENPELAAYLLAGDSEN